jgi:hypothetical protein
MFRSTEMLDCIKQVRLAHQDLVVINNYLTRAGESSAPEWNNLADEIAELLGMRTRIG